MRFFLEAALRARAATLVGRVRMRVTRGVRTPVRRRGDRGFSPGHLMQGG